MSEPSWQPDADAVVCALCHRRFSFFNRRHHCRKCGQIVCNACSAQEIRYFTSTLVVLPLGRSRALPYELYRTCDACVDEIRMIRHALFAEGGGSSLDDPENGDLSIADSTTLPVHPLAAQAFAHANSSSSSVLKHATARTRTRLIHLSTQSSINQDNDSASTLLDVNLCPVCAADLTQMYGGTGIDGFELFKEAHINSCLTQFDFSFDHGRSPTAQGNRMHTRNKMLVYNIPPIPPPKFETIDGMQSRSFNDLDSESNEVQHSGSGGLNDVAAMSVGLDMTIPLEKVQAGQECVICLEDLKPGDKVGRLECLCVFHYKCIKDWFNKKGYGECPVHFLHR